MISKIRKTFAVNDSCSAIGRVKVSLSCSCIEIASKIKLKPTGKIRLKIKLRMRNQREACPFLKNFAVLSCCSCCNFLKPSSSRLRLSSKLALKIDFFFIFYPNPNALPILPIPLETAFAAPLIPFPTLLTIFLVPCTGSLKKLGSINFTP